MAIVPTENYGLMTGLANGVNSFLNTYTTMKNIQHQQQMQEMTAGVTHDENGNLSYTPAKQAEIEAKTATANNTTQGYLPNSDYSTSMAQKRGILAHAGNPNIPTNAFEGTSASQQKELEGYGKADIGAYGKLQNPMAAIRDKQLSYQQHKDAVKSVTDDKSTGQLLTGYQNLGNALANFEKGGATTQDFAELQQAVRANLGIKGTSGVSERESAYVTSLGLNADKIKQFLSGSPQSVLKSDSQLADQVMGLAKLEMKNKSVQAKSQIMKKAGSLSSVYTHPGMEGYQGDFQKTLGAQFGQFGLDENGNPAEEPQAAAAQAPQKGIMGNYDKDVLDYAKSHKISPDVALTIKNKRNASQVGVK